MPEIGENMWRLSSADIITESLAWVNARGLVANAIGALGTKPVMVVSEGGNAPARIAAMGDLLAVYDGKLTIQRPAPKIPPLQLEPTEGETP